MRWVIILVCLCSGCAYNQQYSETHLRIKQDPPYTQGPYVELSVTLLQRK